MLTFIQSQLLFYISIVLVLFLPGYFLLLAAFGRNKFALLEKLVISFGLSIISFDFLMLLMGKLSISITRLSIFSGILIFLAICFGIYKFRENKFPKNEGINKMFDFSKNQGILIIFLLFLTIFIKTSYLRDSIFPNSTDLGHHMYWSKLISETGQLPVYEETNIIKVDGSYQISPPQKIADFIIGEHLIFSAINLLSGISFVSYFPSSILFLIDIFSILAIFILTIRIFEDKLGVKSIAILALFLIGPVYAISSPQIKFASGGVIGNIIGNLFIPLAFYFYLRALKEKSSAFFAVALFISVGLGYTHHLSMLIFIFAFIFTFAIFFVFNIRRMQEIAKEWKKIIFSPAVISVFIMIIIFIFFVYIPTYLNAKAIDTAVGAPSKDTRAGLTFTQFKFSAGEARMAIGIIGIILLLFYRKLKNYSGAIIAGWTLALFVMSLWPNWLLVNIISSRIGNYASFPLAILSAFVLFSIFSGLQNQHSQKNYLAQKFLLSFFSLILLFVFSSGFYDNSQSLSARGAEGNRRSVETFHASEYLAKNINSNDVVLKDHNYIAADSWIKLFFMRGYAYPLSRGYFRRYDDSVTKRESCTLWMISVPNTADGEKCFSGTGTDFVMLNPQYDSMQFQKSKNFWQIYSGKEINIYYKAT
jgi:hypothetical protein